MVRKSTIYQAAYSTIYETLTQRTKLTMLKATKTEAKLSEGEISRIIEMAWEDRTPFEVIETTFGLCESETIKLMRRHMKPSSFRLWRKRVTGRLTKHRKLRGFDVGRGYCPTQYKR